MPKPVFGLILGAILGALDGATAAFYPDTKDMVGSIMMWSGLKSLIGGAIIGFFAAKVNSLKWGILFGGLVGLAFAYLVAMTPDPATGKTYYAEIMIPGTIVGLILGWATQKYGKAAAKKA